MKKEGAPANGSKRALIEGYCNARLKDTCDARAWAKGTHDKGKVSLVMADRLAVIENLENQHRGLDAQLEVLMRRAYLTPIEQQTARELKKRKLNAKDRIAALKRILGR